MTNPVPGYSVSTPYGRRGPYWSCDEDASGNGIHTGADLAAPAGTRVVAARPGTVRHSSHGSAFGYHQVDVLAGDGTRDFYAHMRTRVPDGTKVHAGDKVGEVGTEGNVTGAHLHFERHATETGGWSCSVVRDPAPSLNYHDDDPEDDDMPLNDADKKWIQNQIDASTERLIDRMNYLVGDVVKDPTAEDDENTVFAKTALSMLLNRTD